MLVQFTRLAQGLGGEERFISINPEEVSAVFDSQQDEGAVVVRMKNGSGFAVRGSYVEVVQRLQPTRQFDETQQAE